MGEGDPNPMRLGVFLPNWVGDVVMATPAIRACADSSAPMDSLLA